MATKHKKWTKKLQDFLLDEMIKGKDPTNIIRENSDKLPSESSFHRRQIDDLDFREKVDIAYTCQYQQMKAELHELTSLSAMAAMDKYGTLASGEEVDFKSAAEFKKSRIDAIKFELGKLAGTFSKRYDKKQTLEVTGQLESQHTFVLPDYVALQASRTIDIEDGDEDEAK